MAKRGFHETVGCLANFKVYPGRGNRMASERRMFFQAYVFRDVRSMHSFARRIGCDPTGAGAFVTQADEMKEPMIGLLFLCKPRLGSEVVSHESVHMATYYLRKTNLRALRIDQKNPGDACVEREECLAYAVGNCAAQVVEALYEWDLA